MESKIHGLVDKFINSILIAGDNKYRLCELEVYLSNEEHDDIFTHKSPEQRVENIWYFHKKGNTYKSGTYKGVDICHPLNGGYCGILIRSIINIENEKFIEGPCCVVNEILNSCSCSSINMLVESIKNKENYCDIYNNNCSLYIQPFTGEFEKKIIYNAPRVGLTLKNYTEQKCNYIMKNYRYSTCPEKIKKNKFGWVLSLYMKNESMGNIRKITGSSKRKIEEYIGHGKCDDIDQYISKALKVKDLCRMYLFLNSKSHMF